MIELELGRPYFEIVRHTSEKAALESVPSGTVVISTHRVHLSTQTNIVRCQGAPAEKKSIVHVCPGVLGAGIGIKRPFGPRFDGFALLHVKHDLI